MVVETKHWTGVVPLGESGDAGTLTPVFGQRFIHASPIKRSAAKHRVLRNLLSPGLWAVEGLGPFSMKR
nr:nuclease-related domain-containing protein [Paraburkholderia aspalathi]